MITSERVLPVLYILYDWRTMTFDLPMQSIADNITTMQVLARYSRLPKRKSYSAVTTIPPLGLVIRLVNATQEIHVDDLLSKAILLRLSKVARLRDWLPLPQSVLIELRSRDWTLNNSGAINSQHWDYTV